MTTSSQPQCERCGYNLTGIEHTTTLCPECGFTFALNDSDDLARTRIKRRVARGVVASLILAGLCLGAVLLIPICAAGFLYTSPLGPLLCAAPWAYGWRWVLARRARALGLSAWIATVLCASGILLFVLTLFCIGAARATFGQAYLST